MSKIRKFFCVVFLVCLTTVSAQNRLNSPYSRFGMGDISLRTSAANRAMGGTSLAFQSATAANFANPASYAAYDSMSCLFDVSFSYKNQTLTAESAQKGSSIYFDYLAFGLPISKWWKTSFGFQPFSSMSYTINRAETQTDTVTTSFLGDGGVNEVYWGNAFKLFNNFSIGFNASYLFGQYTRSRVIMSTNSYFANSITSTSNMLKGFSLTLGLQYFAPIKEKGKLGFGLVYTPAIPVKSSAENQTITYLGATIDTLFQSYYPKVKHTMPQSIGGGISWSKGLHYFIGADFSWTNWANYAVKGGTDSLVNSFKISIGGNYMPNPTGSKYLSRMVFSLGANYEQTHLKLNDIPLTKMGVNLGLQFPVRRSKTSFGLIFEYGQMGTTEQGLIKETYFKTTISIRVHEQWYRQRQLE